MSSLALGCTGNIGGETATGPQPPPEVAPIQVPENPEVLQGDSTCVALRQGERLLSVSPEGHAWLAVPGAGTSSVRVLDALDLSGMTEVIQDIELTELNQVQAWNAGDAALVAAEGLWRLEQLARIQLTPPAGFENPAEFCGDPGTNGAILSNGSVFERREDGQWWGWDPAAEGDTVPNALVRYDGECQGQDDVFWMTSPDGTLWRVEADAYTQPVRFEALTGAAVTQDLLMVLEKDRLWVGPESWQSFVFPNGTPSAVTASNGFVWMLSGDQLLRFDGENFAEVEHSLGNKVSSANAYAGGVWLVGADEICHHSVGPVLRVDGIRPYVRSAELLYDFTVASSDAEAEVTAELNGEALALTFSDVLNAYTGRAHLDHAGWHELRLSVAGSDDARSLLVKRLATEKLSWETDVRPIYEGNCTGSDCHGSNPDVPALDTYEAWVNLADKIQTRVVDTGTMPPAATRKEDYGDHEVNVIAQWLEGGLLP